MISKILFKEIPEGFTAWWVRPLGIIWAIATGALLYDLFFIFDGPDNFYYLFDYLNRPDRIVFLKIFMVSTVVALAIRTYFLIVSITHHDKLLNYKLTDRYILFCISSIVLMNILIFIVYFFLGLLLMVFYHVGFREAYDMAFDFNFLRETLIQLRDRVPTLVELPYWAAILLAHTITAFIGYWFHRLAHESRILWLLSHRPHHYSTTLTGATTFEADPKFVIGLLWRMFIFVFVGGIVSKLFFSESPIFIELILISMVGGTLEVFSHTSAYYEKVRNNKLLYYICYAVGGSGPFHYLHHSADEKHTVANIGGGIFLFMDHLFGTYFEPPMKKPDVGLTHQPEMYMNPINASLAGLLQIIYELRHNPPKNWFKILFGGVYYLPPNTKSYLFKDEKSYYASDPKVGIYNPNMRF